MNRHTASALALIALLSGCAADGTQQQRESDREASYTPTGTLIPRKVSSRADNITLADKQALENARMTGNNTMSGTQR